MTTVQLPADRLPLHECRAAARQLKSTRRGRTAISSVRRRGVSWVLRDRLPLSLLLCHAALERRLVQLDTAGFALLEYPGGRRDSVRRHGAARWLYLLDQYWSNAVFAAPPAMLLPLSASVVVVFGRGPAVLSTAMVAVLLAVLWIVVLLTVGVLAAVLGGWRSVERTPDPVAHAAGPLTSAHWTVSLCHVPNPDDLPALLRRVRSRVAELERELPGPSEPARGTELLLCSLDGFTTAAAEQAAAALPDGVILEGTRPRLLALGDRNVVLPTKPPSYPARGIFLILGGSVAAIAMIALLVAHWDRHACTALSCPGGLNGYMDALQYLVGHLIPGASADGQAPADDGVRVLGWFVSLLGLTLMACVVVAVGRHIAFQRHGVAVAYSWVETMLAVKQPTFGLVTAIPEEYAAMVAMLDERMKFTAERDRGTYVLGSLPSKTAGIPHWVVLTLMLEAGNDLAAAANTNLSRSFDSVNCVIMCGIAAGVPNPRQPDKHVRLGDIVVATWGIVGFDHVDQHPDGVTLREGTPQPSALLKGSANRLRAAELTDSRPWEAHLDRGLAALPASFARPAESTDVLFAAGCPGRTVPHPDRTASGHRPGRPKVHYGRIGSSERSLRAADIRDALANKWNLRALEMEGKGIGTASALNGMEWLVIRGISDYGDEVPRHTGWRNYAAVVAASYVRALLAETPPLEPRGGHVRGQLGRDGSFPGVPEEPSVSPG